MKTHFQHQISRLIDQCTFICFTYSTLFFNFQNFWGGSSPPCPSPCYGPDNEVQPRWKFNIVRFLDQRPNDKFEYRKDVEEVRKKWIFYRDVKVFLDGKKSFLIKDMEILLKKYAEFRKNCLCRARVRCKAGVIVLWLECAYSLVQEEILKSLHRLKLTDSDLSTG